MGNTMQIRLARKDGVAIAALLTLRHRSCMVYKYGCSDERFHNLGGMPFLFWKLIEESKAAHICKIDFGRSDLDNASLITFKDRFGTSKKRLSYVQYPRGDDGAGVSGWDVPAVRRLFSILPEMLLPVAGGLLYRHIG